MRADRRAVDGSGTGTKVLEIATTSGLQWAMGPVGVLVPKSVR